MLSIYQQILYRARYGSKGELRTLKFNFTKYIPTMAIKTIWDNTSKFIFSKKIPYFTINVWDNILQFVFIKQIPVLTINILEE